jgi:hypothetical protein
MFQKCVVLLFVCIYAHSEKGILKLSKCQCHISSFPRGFWKWRSPYIRERPIGPWAQMHRSVKWLVTSWTNVDSSSVWIGIFLFATTMYTGRKMSESLSYVTVNGKGQGGEQDTLCAIASPPYPYLGWLATNVCICDGQRSSEISCDKYTDRLWDPSSLLSTEFWCSVSVSKAAGA